jgi:hypothetical protein
MFSHTHRLKLKYVTLKSNERDIPKAPKNKEKFGQSALVFQLLDICEYLKLV